LCADLAAERRRVDVVDKGALAVDLDDRQPFTVARLELRVAADVDLFQLERHFRADAFDDRARQLAEMTALRVEKRDSGYG
jgi:hypothetical protein